MRRRLSYRNWRRMLSRFRCFLCYVICLLATSTNGSPSRADNLYDWDFYELGDPSGWAAYFWRSARIRLGGEHRLPNGVSWRLLTDVNSGIAIPRLTWMPDKQRLRTANHLLDIVQGGEMLIEKEEWRNVERENEFRVNRGVPPLEAKHAITQWDVGLTYVGSRLMSLMSAAFVETAGNKPPALLRGLTFDLESGTIEHVRACPGNKSYGFLDSGGPRGASSRSISPLSGKSRNTSSTSPLQALPCRRPAASAQSPGHQTIR